MPYIYVNGWISRGMRPATRAIRHPRLPATEGAPQIYALWNDHSLDWMVGVYQSARNESRCRLAWKRPGAVGLTLQVTPLPQHQNGCRYSFRSEMLIHENWELDARLSLPHRGEP